MYGRVDGARESFRTILILMAIPLSGVAIFFFWQWLNGGITPAQAASDVTVEQGASALRVSALPVPAAGALKPNGLPQIATRKAPLNRHHGRIVLIIDDLGFDGQSIERVMALDPNVNCSILPNGARAWEFAEKLNARGYEVLCHLPMQPRGTATPGANAVLTSMESDEITRVTRQNIESVPHARGVNNHMGSLATTDPRVMASVIAAFPDGMYFIDSRTTSGSVAANVAREMNIRTASRDVFLDDVATEGAVRRQLAVLAREAERQGLAIGIGHPYDVTLRVLAEELPALRARGVRLVRASEVVR